MNILIRGVRNNIHSVSMVNQFLLLSWQGMAGIKVRHEDVYSHWPAADCGFDASDRAVIESFQQPGLRESFDIVLSFDEHQLIDEDIDPTRRYLFVVTEFGRFKPDALAAIKHHIDQGAHILTPSKWSAQRLLHRFGEAAGPQIEVIAHGVNPKYYWPRTEAWRSQARAALGIAPEEFVFMNLGAGTWNKGVDLLLKGFDQVLASGRRARLILKDIRSLYGYQIDNLINDMIVRGEISGACADKIVLCPGCLNLPQLGELYNLADCYVSPYRAEGFNMPVLEALACGTPVIVTRDGATRDFADSAVSFGIQGSMRELTAEQGLGHYIEPSSEHLLSLMLEAVDQDVRRSRRFADGLSTVAQRHGWDVIARRHLDVFGGATVKPVQ